VCAKVGSEDGAEEIARMIDRFLGIRRPSALRA
jgi:hypothetical protein